MIASAVEAARRRTSCVCVCHQVWDLQSPSWKAAQGCRDSQRYAKESDCIITCAFDIEVLLHDWTRQTGEQHWNFFFLQPPTPQNNARSSYKYFVERNANGEGERRQTFKFTWHGRRLLRPPPPTLVHICMVCWKGTPTVDKDKIGGLRGPYKDASWTTGSTLCYSHWAL